MIVDHGKHHGTSVAQHLSVQSACRVIQQERLLRPNVAIVLGSGLGALADQVLHAKSIAYADIPGFPVPHAAGHEGRLILGYISGVPIVLMQGRTHRYEGRSPQEIQFPIRVMHALGAETLIVTNAAGGLNTRFQVGDLMIIDSHIDMLWPRNEWPRNERPRNERPRNERLVGSSPPAGDPSTAELDCSLPPSPLPARNNPYSPGLIRKVRNIALRKGMAMQQGCYLGTLGPTYETRSEYRFFAWAGADAVGMSTISEVLVARDLDMRVLAFSVITNVASTDSPNATSHEEVVKHGHSAGPRLMSIVRQYLDELSGQPD